MLFLLAFCTLSLAAFAIPLPRSDNVIQLPMRRQHRLTNSRRAPETARRANGLDRRSRHAASQPLGRNFSDSGPFIDTAYYFDEVFTLDVTYGTPPQAFNVTIDYQWDLSYVFGAGRATAAVCEFGPLASRRHYDPTKSTTAKVAMHNPLLGSGVDAPYVPPGCFHDWVDAPFYNDTLTVGSLSVTATFIFCDQSEGVLSSTWPSDAILGISHNYEKKPKDDTNNLFGITELLSQLPANLVTVYYDRTETSADLLGGHITFGGVDTQHCDSKWSYTPNIDDYFFGWTINVATFSFGNKYKLNRKLEAIVESIVSVIIGPSEAVDFVVGQVGAEYDFASDSYVVPCAKIGTLPDMVFELDGGFLYHIPDKDYIRELPGNKKGQCTLMLSGGSHSANNWWLGSTFGRAYCTLLDYDNYRVGFAKVLN